MARAFSTTGDITKDKLWKDMQTVVEDAESLLKATANQAGDKIQEVRVKAQESLNTARERLRTMEQDAVRKARALASEGDAYVHENPWMSIGIAAGAGLLIGLLLSRR